MEDAKIIRWTTLKWELNNRRGLGWKNGCGNWVFPRSRRARLREIMRLAESGIPDGEEAYAENVRKELGGRW